MTDPHPTADEPVDGTRAEEVEPPPISFWIMVGLFALYLAWRLIQGVVWVVQRVL